MLRLRILFVGLATIALAGVAQAASFVSPLAGDEEVPARDTQARGNAVYDLSEDGLSIHYKVVASNIDNITMSHIHLAAKGVNGSIVCFLFGPVAAGGGRSNGILAEGTITAANLIGPLAGHPLSDLIAAMRAGNTYTNVHTNDGVDPPNTGAGDFPGGEIRGQIRPTD